MDGSRYLARSFPLLPLVLATWLTGCQEGGELTQPPPEGATSRSSFAACGVRSGEPTGPPLQGARANATHLAGAAARVSGGGAAIVTDIDGLEYTARFAISGRLDSGGTARGSINFVFGPEFSEAWGAVAGVHKIHVWGKVTSITVAYGGQITLAGTATEVDVSRGGERIVFPDEPFEVGITGPGAFTFQWCLLPPFGFQVTDGTLTYHG